MFLKVHSVFNTDLEKLWTDFEKYAVRTPFQAYAWLSHWQDTVGAPLLSAEPQIVHIYDDMQTIAILPFIIKKQYGISILEWMGGTNSDYMGPLIHPDLQNNLGSLDFWKTLKFNLNYFDVIHFQKQPKWAVEFLGRIGFSFSYNKNLKAYKTVLPANWDTYLSGMNKRLRSDSRRQIRRMEKMGSVGFVPAENPENKTKIIQSMIKQKSRRFRETGVRNILAISEYQQFYEGLANISSENFKVHCSCLNVNDFTVATHVGIVDASTFYYLMPAHEGGDWEKYSPGRLLLLELLKWSIENGLQFFDFTAGEDPYKKKWSDTEIDLFENIIPLSFKGKSFVIKEYAKQRIRNVSWLIDKVRKLNAFKNNV